MATDTTAPTQSDGEVIAHMLAGFGGGGARGRGVVRVGHWTDVRARTGVTVVLLPEGIDRLGRGAGWSARHPGV
jgi:hypothetical protein